MTDGVDGDRGVVVGDGGAVALEQVDVARVRDGARDADRGSRGLMVKTIVEPHDHAGAQLVVDEPVEKDELLRRMCDQLVREGVADEGFLASTLERERVADTSLNEVFAIPHTMRPDARRTMVSAAILKRPVRWSERCDTVQIVFLLAVRPGDRVEMEHLYDLLVRIVEDHHLQQELIGVASYAQFLEVLSGAV